jgi:hypothetical protein
VSRLLLHSSRGPVERFYGATTVTSNEVVQAAAQVVRLLAKGSDPLAGAVLRFRRPTSERIPFFMAEWRTAPDGHGADYAVASVEIDGRDRSIVRLTLFDPAFWDLALEKRIKAKVYRPDQTNTPPPVRRIITYPKPTTNSVERAIEQWLTFCDVLGLDPGNQTSLASVDWEQTFTYTNVAVSRHEPVSRIRFRNGTLFETIRGIVYCHCSLDACFAGPYLDKTDKEWAKFQGRVSRKWQDAVRDLESRLDGKLGIPKTLYSPSQPFPRMLGPNVGETGCARALVYWHRLPRLQESDSADEDFRSFFYAEFDLQSGQVKLVAFHDPKLIEALGRALQARVPASPVSPHH